MEAYYLIGDNGIQKSDSKKFNLKIFKASSDQDKENFIDTYNLPKDIFHFDDMPEIAPRIETVKNEVLGKVTIFVISNINTKLEKQTVKKRLESHTFLLTENKLFWFMHKNTFNTYQFLFDPNDSSLNSLESIIIKTGVLTYKTFAHELDKQKQRIDELYNLAIYSTSNEVLINVADTERDMVMLQHTIENQESAFEKLLQDDYFIEKLNNDLLIYDINWYNRQVNQLVKLYRDLLDATSSLFTDIMSNNLNQLMKFLSTLSLILTSSTFIASLWGMNTGGLPFKEHQYGTMFMLFVSFLAGFIMYLYLKNKDRF